MKRQVGPARWDHIDDATLIAHYWGGPIGLAAIIAQPDG